MPLVELSLAGPVATLTLADEARRNALSAALLAEMIEGIDRAERDDAARVLLLTHRGPVFCAGADLSGGPVPPPGADLVEVILRLVRSPLPVVARIEGAVLGGGLGLAAACDIALVSSEVQVAFTEVRLGVVPAIISVLCLQRLREVDAREMFLRGHRVEASEAVRAGLLTRAVSPHELDAQVAAVLADLLEGAPGALAEAKQLVLGARGATLEEELVRARDLSARLFSGDEAREGITAFVERRPPSWSPRSA